MPNLKRYKSKPFPVFQGLKVGADTRVQIKELQKEFPPKPDWVGGGEKLLRIRATVELVADVVLVAGECAGCETKSPLPDDDGLWFLVENHDGNRLVFPMEEDCEGERDRYPVPGWGRFNAELYCETCLKEVQAAVKNLKRKK